MLKFGKVLKLCINIDLHQKKMILIFHLFEVFALKINTSVRGYFSSVQEILVFRRQIYKKDFIFCLL